MTPVPAPSLGSGAAVGMKGLLLAESPPLWIPVSFLLTPPLAMVAGGALLAAEGSAALVTPFAPETLALAHLGTLGMLATAMVGALYQLVPVVAGRPVPARWSAPLVLSALLCGIALLVAGLLGATTLHAASALLAIGFAAFVAQMAIALTRGGPEGTTVDAMRLAVASLTVVVGLGLLLAHRHATHTVGSDRISWLLAHIVFGMLGWVGTLLAGVSWRVVPMFHLAPEIHVTVRRAILWLVAAGLLSTLFLLATGSRHVAWGGASAALALFVVQPIAMLRSLAARRRRLRDGPLFAWQISMGSAIASGMAALLSLTGTDVRAPLLFGWLAVFGWAGTAVHGMLTRIVPFLTWYHRSSGRPGAPTMRTLLPDERARAGIGLHLLALTVGVLAIVTRSGLLAHATGVLVLTTGVWLGSTLAAVLVPRRNRADG